MNRVASRSMIVLVLVLALAVGLVFFFGEFLTKSGDWILFSGSPYVYDSEGKIDTGTVSDRNGVLLADLTEGRRYASDPTVREAMLHWVGDRQGNIRAPYVAEYTPQMLGYDLANGTYNYGGQKGNITLTLSARLQTVAQEAMGDYRGTVAVYNYKTGELLCAVTTPNFDPDAPPDLSADTEGLYEGVYWNRFMQSKYIPGSIFKIVTLAAALETMPELTQERFTCQGVYELGGGDVTCERSHGTQNLKEAFCNSCNCVFAQITQRLGAERLAKFVDYCGVTAPVSFDGYTSAAGNFDVEGATLEQVAWSGIGQHKDQINPCAYLAFLGSVAGGGVGAKPYVVSQVSVGEQVTYRAASHNTDRILSKNTAQTIREYMRNNVQTKYGVENFPDLVICAKSGTGEVGGDKKPNAMFAGFVAEESCPLAFIVAIEDGGYGTQVCVPVISTILEACAAEIRP